MKEVWWLDSSGVAAHLELIRSVWMSFLGGVSFFGGVGLSVEDNGMKMPLATTGSEKASANMDFIISLVTGFLGLVGVSATFDLSFPMFLSEDGVDMLVMLCRFDDVAVERKEVQTDQEICLCRYSSKVWILERLKGEDFIDDRARLKKFESIEEGIYLSASSPLFPSSQERGTQ